MPLLKRKISRLCGSLWTLCPDKVTRTRSMHKGAQRDLPDTGLLLSVLSGSLWTLCPDKVTKNTKHAPSAQRDLPDT